MGNKKPSGKAVASNKRANTKGWLSSTSARPADGVTETAEDRAKHIADEIRNCSREMGIPPCDINWFDFREYATVQWGMNSVNIVRRDITRLGGFAAIRDAYFPREDTDQAVTNKRIREHALLSRRLGAHLADEAFQLKQIEAFSEKVFSGRVKPVGFGKVAPTPPRRTGAYTREIVVMISDTHFGSDIQASATGSLNYGPVQEARYMAQLVKQVVEYKAEYRAETALRVVILGDLIHGCLHDLRDGAVMAEQKDRAMHLFIQAIAQFSAAYRKVTVECITGNHGRDKMRHPKRATSSKWDSNEMTIYSAVRRACGALKNVEWHIPLSAFGTFSIFGKRYFYTHGDTVIKVPQSAISQADLEKQVNRLNATLRDRDEYAVVMMGHAHKFVYTALDNGCVVLVNGGFTAIDEYATSIGIFESVSSQIMFEAVPGFPVGDLRRIILDKKVAEDASLDKIIQPWRGFDA